MAGDILCCFCILLMIFHWCHYMQFPLEVVVIVVIYVIAIAVIKELLSLNAVYNTFLVLEFPKTSSIGPLSATVGNSRHTLLHMMFLI